MVAEIHNADVALIVYACDLPDSFPRLRSFWLPFVSQQRPDLPIVIVANKVDLRSGDRSWNIFIQYTDSSTSSSSLLGSDPFAHWSSLHIDKGLRASAAAIMVRNRTPLLRCPSVA